MPDNKNIELKIIDTNLKYDLNKHIYFKSNLGEIKMDFKDALEIMHTLLDATYNLNSTTEKIIYEIEDEWVS